MTGPPLDQFLAIVQPDDPDDLLSAFQATAREAETTIGTRAAQVPLGILESVATTATGVTKLAEQFGLPGQVRRLPPILSDILASLLERVRSTQEPTTTRESLLRLTGRIGTDIASIAGGAGALKTAVAATGRVVPRLITTAGASVPLTVAQAAVGPEESITGVSAELLAERFPRLSATLDEIAQDPAARIAVEAGIDFLGGVAVEGLLGLRASKRTGAAAVADDVRARPTPSSEPGQGPLAETVEDAASIIPARSPELPPPRIVELENIIPPNPQPRRRFEARPPETPGARISGSEAVVERLRTADDALLDALDNITSGRASRMGVESGVAATEILQTIAASGLGATVGGLISGQEGFVGGAAGGAVAGILLSVRNRSLRQQLLEALGGRRTAERAAMIDELTGVNSTGAFRRALPGANADPEQAISLFDVSNLKAMNDLVSMPAGDALLARAAAAIRLAADEFGLGERVFRVGGDEFAVIARRNVADTVAERAREIFGQEFVPGTEFRNFLRSGTAGTFDEVDRLIRQAKRAESAVGEPKFRLMSEGGVVAPEVIQAVTGALAGATVGAAVTEDRLTGAVVGGAAGALVPSAVRALRRGGQPAGEAARVGPAIEEAAEGPRRRLRGPRQLGVPAPAPGRVQFESFGLDDVGIEKLNEQVAQLGNIRRRVTIDEIEAAARDLGIEDIARAELNNTIDGVTMLAIRNQYSGNLDQLNQIQRRIDEIDSGRASFALDQEGRQIPMNSQTGQIEAWRIGLAADALDQENTSLLRVFISNASEQGRDFRALQIAAKRSIEDPFPWLVQAQRRAGRSLIEEEKLTIAGLSAARDRPGMIRYMQRFSKPASFGEAVNAVRRASLLFGLRTQARNALSNTGEAIMRVADQPAAVLGDRIASWVISNATGGEIHGLRSRTMLGLSDRIQASQLGIRRSFKKFTEIMVEGADLDEAALRKVDLRREMLINNRVADGYVKFMFRLQGAVDQPWRQMALMESLFEQANVLHRGLRGAARREAVERTLRRPPDEFVFQAMADGEEAVFQNKNAIGTFLSGASQGLEKIGAGRGVGAQSARVTKLVFDFVVPFKNTPGAVVGRLIERTPLGLLSSAAGLLDLHRLAKSGTLSVGELQKIQRGIATRFGRGATGSVAIYLGWLYAQGGIMSGRWPDNPTDARRWIQEGRSEDSIFLDLGDGGKWRKLSGISPLGNLMAIGAQLYHDATNEDYDPSEEISFLGTLLTPQGGTSALLTAARTAKEQSFLRGTKDLLDAIDNERGAGSRFFPTAVGSFIPILVADFARFYDPVIRDPRTAFEAIKTKLPVMSVTVPARLDEFGRPRIPQPTEAGRLIRFIDPFLSQRPRAEVDPILREFNRVQAIVPRQRRLPEETVEDFRIRQQFEGQESIRAVQDVVQVPAYQRLDAEAQKDVLQNLVTNVRRELRRLERAPSSWRPLVNATIRRARDRARN